MKKLIFLMIVSIAQVAQADLYNDLIDGATNTKNYKVKDGAKVDVTFWKATPSWNKNIECNSKMSSSAQEAYNQTVDFTKTKVQCSLSF